MADLLRNWGFVLAFPEIDFHKLKWDLLVQNTENSTNAAAAREHPMAIELENHYALGGHKPKIL